MTTKDAFTEDDWTRVRRAPLVAGLAISIADPGGPIEAAKESMATLKNAVNPPTHEQLLTEVALDIQAMSQSRENPLKGFKPTGPNPGESVLDELRGVLTIVSARATPEESAAFGAWLGAAAQAAAEAAKDGGFLGFGAQQVSDREQAMVDQVRAAVTG